MERCSEHGNICEKMVSMEETLNEVKLDIKDIKQALIGTLDKPGWITLLTNEDKELKNRVVELEKKIAKFEGIFEKFIWKLVGALTTAALMGGGVTAIIQNLIK